MQAIENVSPIEQNPTSDWLKLVSSVFANSFLFLIMASPELAFAQQTPTSPFGGITDFLKSIANLLIFEWGYYLGIITLGIQGYRWKTGRIDLMQLGGWGLGIGLVFFAPNIVADLRSRAGGIV